LEFHAERSFHKNDMDSNGFALTKSSAQIEGFRSKKELERIAARKVPSWYALDHCGNPSRFVASRLLDFSYRRGFNTCSFGDRCDCGDNKARDRSARLNMNGFTVVVRPCESIHPGKVRLT
jgi:hypothetical protein